MHRHLKHAFNLIKAHDFDSELSHQLSAVIVRGGSIISTGYNRLATNSFVEYYADQLKGRRDFCLSTHAEMDAVLKARAKTDLTGCKIFVARKRLLDGEPGMSRPCPICEEVLRRYGIRRAFYTIDNDHYGIMKIDAFGSSDKIVRINS